MDVAEVLSADQIFGMVGAQQNVVREIPVAKQPGPTPMTGWSRNIAQAA
jgi:hypothetical protein